jgi:hypothetical protein
MHDKFRLCMQHAWNRRHVTAKKLVGRILMHALISANAAMLKRFKHCILCYYFKCMFDLLIPYVY